MLCAFCKKSVDIDWEVCTWKDRIVHPLHIGRSWLGKIKYKAVFVLNPQRDLTSLSMTDAGKRVVADAEERMRLFK